MSTPAANDTRPLVASLCGTFLKPEMQSVYRQITGLKDHRTVVLTEQRTNPGQFPFDPVIVMDKITRPRLRGNFLLRFWYKYVIRQWPPPRPINKEVKPYYPYNLPDILRREQPALVHVYYGHKAVKYRSMLKAWGGAWIVSFHGVDVAKFFDRPGYAEKMAEVFREAKLVLGRSQSLLDKLESLGCPKHKLRLNPTPIPLDGYPVCAHTTPADGSFRLVQASRLIAKKGLFTTLKAMETVAREFPRAKFILCGDGPDREAFARAVVAAGLQDNIELLGWIGLDELRREFAAAHLFLHPSEMTASEDQEGVPNSMLEAMATGLPVVATVHGGIPEAVCSGEDGLLVAEKDPVALAQAILTLLRDAAMRDRLGAHAAARVRATYGLEASLCLLEAAYAEAIASDGE